MAWILIVPILAQRMEIPVDDELCKGSLFQCRDTVCSILCMQGCSYRSDTEEKEYDVRSEVTEFRNEQSR